MHATKRMSSTIWTLGAVMATALLFAGSATAHDSHRSHRAERLNNYLDSLAIIAALSGDALLVVQPGARGDRIAHQYHRGNDWRRSIRKHHRHFDGCGHHYVSQRRGHKRHAWHNPHNSRRDRHDRHDGRRQKRHSKRGHRN